MKLNFNKEMTMKNVFLCLTFIAALFVSACGGSGGGSTGGGSPATAPSAPTGVMLAVADTQITPTWVAVTDATSYNAYYRTTTGVTIANGTKIANATSGAPITSLTNGTPYYVVVTAVNANGESALSSEVSATPAVAAPTGVTATAGNGQATVGWSAVTGATSYNVYYGTVAGVTTANQTKVIGATSGSAITGLVNGTMYYFVVTAVNATSESSVSTEVNATPVAPPPPPSAPTGVSIANGNAQVTLTWPNVTGATSYNVYYKTTTGVTIANGTKITNTSSGTALTGFTNGTAYYFVVVAVNAGGESAVSGEVGATPQAPAVGVSSGLTISGGNGQVTLGWSAVTGASSYNVYYGTTAGVTVANGTKVTGATSGSAIINLTNGTKHYFVVTAMSNADTIENPASAEISATPQGIPNLVGGAIQTPLTLAGTVATVPTKVNGVAASLGYGNTGIMSSFGITTDGTNLYVSTSSNQNGSLLTYWVALYQKVVIATGETTTMISETNPGGFLNGGKAPVNSNAITTDGNNLYAAGFRFGATTCWQCYGGYTIKMGLATGKATDIATDFIPVIGGLSPPSFPFAGGTTMDGANLYLTDPTTNTIQKVVIATGAVTTIAGTAGLSGTTDATGAVARFNNPNGITTDGINLYVADTGNNLIRKIVIADGTVTTVAGGFLGLTYDGTGTGARFTAPRGITTDGTNLYVADSGAHAIRKVVIASGVVTTIAGSYGVAGNTNGTGSAALFNEPRSIATDGTSLYVADYTNGVIRKIQ